MSSLPLALRVSRRPAAALAPPPRLSLWASGAGKCQLQRRAPGPAGIGPRPLTCGIQVIPETREMKS